MKILLVHAYNLAADPGEQKVMKPYPPLGVLYLSAYLKQANHQVQVFDGTFQPLSQLREVHQAFQPEVVGFYANMMTRQGVLACRRILAESKALFVVGGPDPPHYAEHYLDQGFDGVIVGEGERTLAAVLDGTVWREIPGLVFRDEGVLVRTSANPPNLDLETLPFPDREAIDLEAYLGCWERYHGMRPISMITSRGCPYRCTWCAHNVYGHSLRKRKPEAVVSEMAWLVERYSFTHYWFADDVFNIQPKWLHALRDLLREQAHLKRPFECIARADRFDAALVETLAELGCFRCWVGAESGSQRLLDKMKRGVKREKVRESVGLLRQAGIETGMFFMWGFSDEQIEDILETVDLAAGCLPDIALTTVAYPIKGTVFYQELAQQQRLGAPPDFLSGSDRDIAILGQQSRDTYRLADKLLHTSLQIERLRKGSLKAQLKAVAHRFRARYFEHHLRRRFNTGPAN